MALKRQTNEHSAALLQAHRESGLSQAMIARKLGVTPAAVRQWLAGERPVPAERARALAKLLRVDPGKISESYATINPENGAVSAHESIREDIEALQLFIAGLISAAVVHRPAEVADVVTGIRRGFPRKLRENAFVRELLATMEAGPPPPVSE